MSEVIVITSGKGGVGKTTSTANIGVGLAYMGYRVLLVDTDLGLRNLDVVMGLENKIKYNLVDIIEGRCRAKQAMIKDMHYPNLTLIAASQVKDKSSVNPFQMKKLIEELRKEFDYVLLDCPAGIESGFKNAVAAADRAFVVTTPEVSAIRDADRVQRLLEHMGIEDIALILNRIRYDMIRKGEMLAVEDVIDILGLTLLGNVPDDASVIMATNHGEPVIHLNCASGTAYRHICRRITGDNVPLLEDIPPRYRRSYRFLKIG